MNHLGLVRRLVTILLAVGFASSGRASATPQVTSLAIWHSQNGGTETALQFAVAAYQSAHPEVNVFIVNKGNSLMSDFHNAVPSGNGPDLLIMGAGNIGDEAVRGNIIPLDYFGVNQEYLQATFEKPAFESVLWRGKAWGLPLIQSGIALIYNKALVTSEYVPANPHDLVELRQKAGHFLADKGKKLLCNPGFGDRDQSYFDVPIFYEQGIPAFVDDFGQAYLATTEAQAAAQWLLDIKPYVEADNSYSLCHDRFLNGAVGIWWNGPWAIPEIAGAGIDYGIVPMGKPYVGTDAIYLSANAMQRGRSQQSIELMKFLSGKETAKAIALQGNNIPANSAALKDPEVQAVKWIALFGEAFSTGVGFPNNPYLPCQLEPVGKAVEAIWNLTMDVKSALDRANTEIGACVAVTKTIPYTLFLAHAVR